MDVIPKTAKLSFVSVAAVFFVVSLNLLGAWILKTATSLPLMSIAALFFLGLVIAINIGRFLLWGWMHRRIDLSKSYPLTAMFFPLVAILSAFKGEHIDPIQWVGVGIITLGVVWFGIFVQDNKS